MPHLPGLPHERASIHDLWPCASSCVCVDCADFVLGSDSLPLLHSRLAAQICPRALSDILQRVHPAMREDLQALSSVPFEADPGKDSPYLHARELKRSRPTNGLCGENCNDALCVVLF